MPTNNDDLLTGSEGADFLQGLSGNDTLQSYSGNDLLYGGADNDLLEASDGIDQLYGGSGADGLYAGTGNDRIEAGSGDDTLHGGGEDDRLFGGEGNDLLEGGMGSDTLRGGLGDDLLQDLSGLVQNGAVFMYGDDGNDRLLAVTTGGGVIDGGNGNDFIDASGNSDTRASNLLLSGGEGNDTIRSSSAGVRGEGGDDTAVLDRYIYVTDADWAGSFDGGEGDDKFYFGTHLDTQSDEYFDVPYFDWTQVTNFEEIIVRSLDLNTNSTEGIILTDNNIGPSGYLTVRNFGSAVAGDGDVYTPLRRHTFDGSAVTIGQLTLIGTFGFLAGSLIGGALSDTISGSGNLLGNSGDDVISGFGTLAGDDGNDTLNGIQDTGTFYGGQGNDVILAGATADFINGGEGQDLIETGEGENTIRGGAGDDTINCGFGTDTVLFSGDFADYAIIDTFGTLTVTGPDGTDVLTGANVLIFSDQSYEVPIPGVIRIGTGDPDYIDGSDGADSLSGESGNDTLLGGLGDDTLIGGEGRDSLDGGADIDTASFIDAATGLIVDLGSGTASPVDATSRLGLSFALAERPDRLTSIENILGSEFSDTVVGNGGSNLMTGGNGNDSLSGAGESDTLSGNSGNDTLFGGIAADSLVGGAGQDSLVGDVGKDNLSGGLGQDTLVGGEGADIFLFAVLVDRSSEDQIVDFESGVDLIGLDVDARSSLELGSLSAANFLLGANARDRDDHILYVEATGRLFFDRDGSASAAKVLIATLTAGLPLSAGDFLIV